MYWFPWYSSHTPSSLMVWGKSRKRLHSKSIDTSWANAEEFSLPKLLCAFCVPCLPVHICSNHCVEMISFPNMFLCLSFFSLHFWAENKSKAETEFHAFCTPSTVQRAGALYARSLVNWKSLLSSPRDWNRRCLPAWDLLCQEAERSSACSLLMDLPSAQWPDIAWLKCQVRS